ncbi:MAG: hypothetical protein KBS70_08265 [Bacteroidales bacterium]|nr:hypothetical protein [Candidatus Colicola equi]
MVRNTETIIADLAQIVRYYNDVCANGHEAITSVVENDDKRHSFEMRSDDNTFSAVITEKVAQYCSIYSISYYFTVKDGDLVLRVYWRD